MKTGKTAWKVLRGSNYSTNFLNLQGLEYSINEEGCHIKVEAILDKRRNNGLDEDDGNKKIK